MAKTTIKVKKDTRKKLKLYATEHGITMEEAINKLLQAQKETADNLPGESKTELVDMLCNTSSIIDDYKAKEKARKAKIDELKEWCKYHSRNTAATKYDRYWKGYQESAIFVFQKLEELDNE